jgi:hypothetical protein
MMPTPPVVGTLGPGAAPGARPLSDTEERFAVAYAQTLNATEAYLAVFPRVKRTSAATLGNRLLRKVEVAGRVREIQAAVVAEGHRMLDEIVTELERIAYRDLTQLFEPSDGSRHPEIVRDPAKLPEPVRRVIKSMKVKRQDGDVVFEVSLYDKLAALELLMRYRGMLQPERPLGADTAQPHKLEVHWVFE